MFYHPSRLKSDYVKIFLWGKRIKFSYNVLSIAYAAGLSKKAVSANFGTCTFLYHWIRLEKLSIAALKINLGQLIKELLSNMSDCFLDCQRIRKQSSLLQQ